MFKNIFTLYLILFISFSYAQNKMEGLWYGIDVKNLDNSDLFINDTNYSRLVIYNFKSNKVSIDGFNEMNYSIYKNNLKIGQRKFHYILNNDSLTLISKEDERVYYLISKDLFRKKYKWVFENDYELIENDTVYNDNIILDVQFKNNENFHEYLKNNINSYDYYSTTNNIFISSFILTKNGEIKSLKIEGKEKTKFYKQLREAILNSEQYWENHSGYDVLINEIFHFFSYERSFFNEETMPFIESFNNGVLAYKRNDFRKAIDYFMPIYQNNSDHLYIKGNILEAKKKLAISYIATNEIEKACTIFYSFKNYNYFQARNYITNFCKK